MAKKKFKGKRHIKPKSIITNTLKATVTMKATLNGLVNPNGHAVTPFFKYGLTPETYGDKIHLPEMTGMEELPISTVITGLDPETEYACVAGVEYEGKEIVNGDIFFTTPAVIVEPTVTTLDATEIGPE